MISTAQTEPTLLQKNCLECHIKQQIPSGLIYRRYLTKYSTHDTITKHLVSYLKNPQKTNSIMPKQFFLRFPTKEALDLNESELNQSIKAYLDYFDIRKKLLLP